MELPKSASGETKCQRMLQEICPARSSTECAKSNEIFKISVTEPRARIVPKPDVEELMDSPIILSQLGTVNKPRQSIISLRIQGKSGGDDSKKLSLLRRNAGILFALFSTFSFSVATLILKVFNQYHQFHPFSIAAWRCLALVVPLIPSMVYHIVFEKKQIFEGIWPPTHMRTLKNIFWITMRALIGVASTIVQIYALQYLNLADASVIFFSSPVFVIFVARIFLGEKAGYFAVVIAIFTLAGVAIIARPPILTGVPIDSGTMLGIIFAIATMLTVTLIIVFLRHLKDVHYSIVSVGYGIQGTFVCLILAAYFDVLEFPGTLLEWGLFVGLIIFTWGGQTTMVLALQLEEAAIVSLINCLDTCCSFLLQFIFLGVVPDLYSGLGAAIVFTGVILTTFRKYVAGLPQENELRKKFRLLLK